MAKPPRDCPCDSAVRYVQCCGPLHREDRLARTPEELMRSRFSAFALGEAPYLYHTLSKAHEDYGPGEAAFVRALGQAQDGRRYLGLSILHASAEGEPGEVLFFAKIFIKGRDHSFAELSTFSLEGGAWRYRDGLFLETSRLPTDPKTLTRAGFLSLF